jgi:membrane-associated phospholipid phosphatase
MRHQWTAVAVMLLCSVALPAQTASECGLRTVGGMLRSELFTFAKGIGAAPNNSVRSQNLRWELPIAATAGVLMGTADDAAANRIVSHTVINRSSRFSNIAIGAQLASAGALFAAGCVKHRNDWRDTAFTAASAVGAASLADVALKSVFRRNYPTAGASSDGDFFNGGRSFPSGHSAASFAFASVIGQRVHNPWLRWGSYALASSIAVARYPAKKHFPSDILIGGTLGYVTGAYMADHAP